MKNHIYINVLLVLLLIFGSGCEETAIEQGFTIDRNATFQLNQIYTSSDGQYTLKITEIGDSRCPEGVVCVWQGEVTVKGEWTVNKNKSTFELHSVLTDQQIQPDNYTIQIIDAKPYPKYGTDTKPEDLSVTLLIKKN